MVIVIVLLIVAVLIFGAGLLLKGLVWLLILGAVVALVAIGTGVRGRIKR